MVAVMPVTVSLIAMSDVDEPPNVSSRQLNSQHDAPIWNDLQSVGGVHRTALQACSELDEEKF